MIEQQLQVGLLGDSEEETPTLRDEWRGSSVKIGEARRSPEVGKLVP